MIENEPNALTIARQVHRALDEVANIQRDTKGVDRAMDLLTEELHGLGYQLDEDGELIPDT